MSVIMVGNNAIYEVEDDGHRREISCSFVPDPEPRDCLWYGDGRIEPITLSEFRRRERSQLWQGFFLLAGVTAAVAGAIVFLSWVIGFRLP